MQEEEQLGDIVNMVMDVSFSYKATRNKEEDKNNFMVIRYYFNRINSVTVIGIKEQYQNYWVIASKLHFKLVYYSTKAVN